MASRVVETLDAPAWLQLPRRTFRENMYVQFSPTLPLIVEDTVKEKIFFDTRQDITVGMEAFYEHLIADDVDYFALKPEYATGFHAMLEALNQQSTINEAQYVKGQITGPISFGLTVTDQDLRASIYNEMLADAIVKNAAMNTRWQVRQLKSDHPNVIIFVDEPYMASFGSAFINLSREQVIAMLNEVFDAIHAEGALAGVHCCANTDWGVMMETKVDILNLDAYSYIENLALYPSDLRTFLDRGSAIAWGIVPNNEEIYRVTGEVLVQRLHDGIRLVTAKAARHEVTISPVEFANRSLVTPVCGLGSTTVEIAEKTFDILAETGKLLK